MTRPVNGCMLTRSGSSGKHIFHQARPGVLAAGLLAVEGFVGVIGNGCEYCVCYPPARVTAVRQRGGLRVKNANPQ